jgi:hypothetical protein
MKWFIDGECLKGHPTKGMKQTPKNEKKIILILNE